MNFQTMLDQAVPLIKQAGDIALDYFNKPINPDFKGEIDVVTEADRHVERFLLDNLKIMFPDIGIVGEEGGNFIPESGDPDYFWYVDPIDGTVNYANHLPQFSILLALATTDREPVLCITYDPLRDECFTAIKGEGAFLNGESMSVSQSETLVQSVLATGFPYDRATSDENNIKEFVHIITKVRGVRRLGSAGLDLAYVAAGRLDGYWEQKLNPWDVLGGILLVQEAGGMVADYDGTQDGLKTDKIRMVASNGNIQQAYSMQFKKVDANEHGSKI